MITYIEVYFSTEGPVSTELAEKVQRETGLSFIRGRKDLAFKWATDKEFSDMMAKIHEAFRGSKAFLKFDTQEEESGPLQLAAQWPPVGGKRQERAGSSL